MFCSETRKARNFLHYPLTRCWHTQETDNDKKPAPNAGIPIVSCFFNNAAKLWLETTTIKTLYNMS